MQKPSNKNESQTTYQSFHGRHNNFHTIHSWREIAIKKAKRTHLVGKDEFQSGEIKVANFEAM